MEEEEYSHVKQVLKYGLENKKLRLETEAAKDQVRLLSENQQKLELENKKLRLETEKLELEKEKARFETEATKDQVASYPRIRKSSNIRTRNFNASSRSKWLEDWTRA